MRLGPHLKSALAALAIAVEAGCGGGSAPPEAIPIEEIPARVQSTFQTAPPEVQALANTVASAVKQRDLTTAFVKLQALSSRPDLSSEQRETAARSMISITEELRTAAGDGDQRAQEMLQMHRAHK